MMAQTLSYKFYTLLHIPPLFPIKNYSRIQFKLQFTMRTNFIHSITILLLFIFSVPYSIQSQDEDVLFQAFDWNVQEQPEGTTWYNVLKENSNRIHEAGIDMIWMPPPSNSAAPQGYLPRELYDLNSEYGTQEQLVDLINTFHNLDIKVLSDIVINHRVGSDDAVTFENPDWPEFFITSEDEGRNFVDFPVQFSVNADYAPGTSLKADGSNGGFAAARDLDHNNPAVRDEIIRWMNFLRNDIGFDGWRYDFVHGYNPIFNKQYNDATNPYFAVGELLESSRVQTNNWINYTQRSSSAFDFNTKVSLQNAIRANNLSFLRDFEGNPSGMIGINPSKSVTFLDNHDTGIRQECCGPNFVFPSDETSLRKGYAYILTHPGLPTVFWSHLFDSGAGVRNAIRDLIAIRKSVRVYAGSTINIVEARRDLYAAYIDGRNGTIAMKLGSGDWSPFGDNWTFRTSGNDYAVWTQGGTTTPPPPPAQQFTVQYKKPASWGNSVNVYFFDAVANATLPGTAAWPGQAMNAIAGTPWYSYTLNPPSSTPANALRVIFNDGSNQTSDLSRSLDGWFANGNWTANCSSDCGLNSAKSISNISTTQQQKEIDAYIWYNNATNQKNLAVNSPVSGKLQVSVSDLSGRTTRIFDGAIYTGTQSIDLNHKNINSKGMYFLMITLDGNPVANPIKFVTQ